MKQLEALQDEQYEWARRNFGPQDPILALLGVVEEVGELCHAVLKSKQNIRQDEDHVANEKDAIADITIFLMDYCNRRGYNLLELTNVAWDEVKLREKDDSGELTAERRDDGSWVYRNPTQRRPKPDFTR